MRDDHRLSTHNAPACCLLRIRSAWKRVCSRHATHERKRALRRRHRHANTHAWQLTHAQLQLCTRRLHHPASRRPDAGRKWCNAHRRPEVELGDGIVWFLRALCELSQSNCRFSGCLEMFRPQSLGRRRALKLVLRVPLLAACLARRRRT